MTRLQQGAHEKLPAASPGDRVRVRAVLAAHDLEARRGRRVLFSHLSLSAAPGQLLRVLGANGSGKTTLLRMLVGLTLPAAGTVSWNGRPISADRDAFHRDLVYLGHAAALKDDLSARENLQSLLAIGGTACDVAQADRALAAAGLAGCERLPARVLSAGQRRRVALARLALAGQQRLWVLDEPFNALDAAAVGWLAGLLGTHLGAGGIVALTSHQPLPLDEGDAVVVAL
ncbi:MAG: cytochrome c biogenesis heme-transporting ATPase CcmA [Burkholderiales bacterium]|nr:cytochrome c biogenesis heme-transporting ATPase CcmA [Burkholderiales bacterium]